jgi:hypothetical protein
MFTEISPATPLPPAEGEHDPIHRGRESAAARRTDRDGATPRPAVSHFSNQDVANASIVPLDGSRQVKIWCGSGSTHVILDIVGYYL